VSGNRQQQQPAKMVVDGATKIYQTRTGTVRALEDFRMIVHEGEFVCLIGPSGCGKSTLLWSMAGLHALSRGRVLLDGKPVVEPHPHIGMVFQEANLLPWRSLQCNIELPFEIKRMRTRDHRDRITALLKRVGLEAFRDKYPRELSGGMQQRASIVRSLSFDPAVLLMDEPFGALDAFTRDEMNLLIQEIWMETGKTIVFVTHNIAEAVFLADRIVVMTPRPGRLSRICHVDFPRPRPIELTNTPQFVAMVADIKSSIDHGAGAAKAAAGA
jgi:NitT/TauT family transport system ATP-binding protein